MELVDQVESIPWRRRRFERDGVLCELLRRAGYADGGFIGMTLDAEKGGLQLPGAESVKEHLAVLL